MSAKGPSILGFDFLCERRAGKSGWYVGSPELGFVNSFNAHAKEDPNAPAANDPVACRRLYAETLRIIKECDPRFQPTTQDIPLEHEREH